MTLEEQFESLDLHTVERFVKERKIETLQLEFKTVADRPMRNNDDKKNLARALSGFANSDGGIVVWGVHTDKVEDIDVAVSESPIPNVQAFEGRLLELESEAVNPIVDGVRHKVLRRDDGSGFVATLVPASDRGPHMAKLSEDRYYKRSGTSFLRCEHFDLDDMFGRRPKPNLALTTRINAGVHMETNCITYQFNVLLGIHNSGRGIARHPFLAVAVCPMGVSEYGLDGNGRHGLPTLVTDWKSKFQRTFAGGVDSVIHAGTAIDVTRTKEGRVQSTSRKTESVSISYRLCAEGACTVDGGVIIPDSDIFAAIEALPNFNGWN